MLFSVLVLLICLDLEQLVTAIFPGFLLVSALAWVHKSSKRFLNDVQKLLAIKLSQNGDHIGQLEVGFGHLALVVLVF